MVQVTELICACMIVNTQRIALHGLCTLRFITGPPNGPVLFCWLAGVCRRRL